MSTLVNLQKIKEISYKELLKSDFVCSIVNYSRVAKMERHRLRITKRFTVGNNIAGALDIYPMGINSSYNNRVSLVLVLESKTMENIEGGFEVVLVNRSGTKAVKPSFEYFEKKPYQAHWTMSHVAEASFLLDSANEMLYRGVLKFSFEIRIFNNYCDEATEGTNSCLLDSFKSPSFGDLVFNVKGFKYYAHRAVLEKGSLKFAELLMRSQNKNQFVFKQIHIKDFENILMDCYLNVYGNIDVNSSK